MVFGGQKHTLLHHENGPQSFNCLQRYFSYHISDILQLCRRDSTIKLLFPDNFVCCYHSDSRIPEAPILKHLCELLPWLWRSGKSDIDGRAGIQSIA